MRIGIVIGRIGGIDGVALETEKWITVLERMGHQVRVLTGELEGEVAARVEVLPELAFSHPAALEAQQVAFLGHRGDEASLLRRLEGESTAMAAEIERWIRRESIECLLSENANAIPLHLTMGMALRRVIEATGLPAVTHDHDFRWERGERYQTPFGGVEAILDECFPLRAPSVRHAVINSAARAELSRRYGIDDALVVPNVMDFEHPPARRDDFNDDLPQALGLADSDRLLFQVTRVVRRKGIEIAIDLVRRLADERIKLIITGTAADERHDGYAAELRALVERWRLTDQVLFAGDRFDASRRQTRGGVKVFSLWDAYVHAAACTYFSLYEGFGNAFVEAVVCRVPIFVNAYEPVYRPDIGAKGFRAVTIEGGQLTDEAVIEARRLLSEPTLRREVVEENFELGRRYFSYEALEPRLTELFERPLAAAGPNAAGQEP